MLLGFIVSDHGIKANLEKILAIMRMGLIQNIKWVQQVIGCLAMLSRLSHASVNEVSPSISF